MLQRKDPFPRQLLTHCRYYLVGKINMAVGIKDGPKQMMAWRLVPQVPKNKNDKNDISIEEESPEDSYITINDLNTVEQMNMAQIYTMRCVAQNRYTYSNNHQPQVQPQTSAH